MSEENFKKCVYIVLALLILVFYTKDIDFFYKKVKDIKNPDSLMVLVNKLNRLQSNYVPHDLEQISLNYATNNKFLRKEAKENFEKLSSDAKKIGYSIIAVSAYRDYDYQENLFNNYVKEKGENYALKCSAKAGHSEHQTGLSVDVMGSNNDYDQFEKSKEFVRNVDYKNQYLKKRRHRVKAEFNVFFSIRVPEDYYTERQKIFMNFPWKDNQYIQQVFQKLNDLS